MKRLIVVGSPRVRGRSAALAEELFEACIDECPEDEVSLASVSTLEIQPCQGCDACKILNPDVAVVGALSQDAANDVPAEEKYTFAALCAIHDDMTEVRELLDEADELIVVSPVYFSGAPAQMKALLDRLQPYFWTRESLAKKRPATLHIVGEGGDPHGYAPLIGVMRSAFSCAGFTFERALDWVGKIDESGEILADAEELELSAYES